MTKNILVLTDFSYCSEKATNFAINLFGVKQVNYTFLHALHYRQFGASFSVHISDEIKTYMENKMKKLLLETKEANEHINVSGEVEFGGVVSTVQFLAEKKNWDCIVLGANGSSGAYEKILGSSANALLNEIDENLLIVPVTAAEHKIDHAVFSTRITETNIKKSLANASDLIGDKIEVLDLMTIYNSEAEEELAQDIFAEWNKEKESFEKKLSPYKNNGEHIENQIIKGAAENESDLLIIHPNKDKSIWERIFSRNISKEVVERTYLPILVIK